MCIYAALTIGAKIKYIRVEDGPCIHCGNPAEKAGVMREVIYRGHVFAQGGVCDCFELIEPFDCPYCGQRIERVLRPCENGGIRND